MKVLCFGSLNIDYTYKVDHFVQKGEPVKNAMDMASKDSAIAVTRQGAAPSIPTMEEVKAF